VPHGERGDGIRFWEVRDSTIAGNHVTDSRDMVVWYSPGNRVIGNTVTGSRYATHFMYSNDSVVEHNTFRRNMVGVFIMYSRGITLIANTIADNTAGDGLGVGSKESGNVRLEDNQLLRNVSGLYLDISPFRNGDWVLARRNIIAGCTTGVTFHSTESHNTFVDNVFLANDTQVAVEGQGTADHVLWRGNYFDDYQGYDLNGDGIGDVPYELRRLSDRLVATHPDLAFFRGTPVLQVLDTAGRVLPFLTPERLLADDQPRMSRPDPTEEATNAGAENAAETGTERGQAHAH
jgi:nitrous oxidase accessory protein